MLEVWVTDPIKSDILHLGVTTNPLIPQNDPAGGFQGVQDAHSLSLLVPSAGVV